MNGENISNVFTINDIQYKLKDLDKSQSSLINSISYIERYIKFKDTIINAEGESIECVIKTELPSLIMRAFDEFGVELIY